MISINNFNTMIGISAFKKAETVAETTEQPVEETAVQEQETTTDTEATVETDDDTTTSYMPRSSTRFNFEQMFKDFRQRLLDMFKPISQRQPEPEPEPDLPIGSDPDRPIYYCMYSIPEIY